MDNKELSGIIDAVGAMAEMTALYFTELTKRGIGRDEALKLSCAFVEAMVLRQAGGCTDG